MEKLNFHNENMIQAETKIGYYAIYEYQKEFVAFKGAEKIIVIGEYETIYEALDAANNHYQKELNENP